MARKKEYRRSAGKEGSQVVGRREPKQRGLLVFVDELPAGARIPRRAMVDLRGWLGRGIDKWVDLMMVGWLQMLDQGAATESVSSYEDAYKVFLEFLVDEREEPLVLEPANLQPLHVTRFIGWLKARKAERNWGDSTVHTKYSHVKRCLVQLLRMKEIHGTVARFFPRRPFAYRSPGTTRNEAFSEQELLRLAKAIKSDLVNLHHGRLVLRPFEAITGRFLIVSMRTGGNSTPLLELSRSAARPGLLPGTKVIRVSKHRAKKTFDLVATGRVKDVPVLIPVDASAVLERTLEETEELVKEASVRIQDRVWLYRSAHFSTVFALNHSSLVDGVRSIVKRHELLGDDGAPLTVNNTRLRKSFGKRGFRLTDGDVVATANLLGNTPSVTESSYLNPDAELLQDAASFMASELAVHLRGDGTRSRVIPIVATSEQDASVKETPVARCRDTLQGEHAPKDGTNHCDNFVMCIFCASFAVVGELDELWRLFSFRRFAQEELEQLDRFLGQDIEQFPHKQLLRKRYRVAIPFIETFTNQHFGAKLVRTAMEKAQATLHPFWLLQSRLAARKRAN